VKQARLILAVVFLGCSQSLTSGTGGTGGSVMSSGGTGGLVTGSGGTGGLVTSSGGTGGSMSPVDAGQVCSALAAQYPAALVEAEACVPGAEGQCLMAAHSSLGCNDCPVYVTDESKLVALTMQFNSAGCFDGVAPSCPPFSCPPAQPGVCVPVSGGGVCSWSPNLVDGGTCTSLAEAYQTALTKAKECYPNPSGAPCSNDVPSYLSSCGGVCRVFVGPTTTLTAIQAQWQQAGCGNVPESCGAPCPPPTGGMCAQTDGGTAICMTY
jgi:hypothetical protein